MNSDQLRDIIATTKLAREARGHAWPEGAEERIFNACVGRSNEDCIAAMQRAVAAEEHAS